MFCKSCGKEIANEAVMCVHCGVGIKKVGASSKSRVAYVLLGFFLGGFGIHNFYAGYGGRGAAQLLITLFLGWLVIPLFAVGVWILIELFTVSVDAQGNSFN